MRPDLPRPASSSVARAALWSCGLAVVAAVGLLLSPAIRAAEPGVHGRPACGVQEGPSGHAPAHGRGSD